ncbi:hypothetical protein AnigIFM59636_003536 [Aspergillus niger]|nr:hypothetical protein AnigIFM59636_003536 [Aspergillus niger]
MSRIAPFKKRRRSESSKAKTQQRSKLKKTLIRKAARYSIECDSDVFVMIRVKGSGRRYIFNSSPSENWLPSMPELRLSKMLLPNTSIALDQTRKKLGHV